MTRENNERCVMPGFFESIKDKLRTNAGNNELLKAVESGNVDKARELIAAGADIKMRSKGKTLLVVAIGENHEAMVEFLLENGAEINTDETGPLGPPLIAAIDNGSLRFVERLIARGADVNLPDEEHQISPLLFACEMEPSNEDQFSIVKALIEAGADINHHDWMGRSALSVSNNSQVTNLLRSLNAAGAEDNDEGD